MNALDDRKGVYCLAYKMFCPNSYQKVYKFGTGLSLTGLGKITG